MDRKVWIERDGVWQESAWETIRTGDKVKVEGDDAAPTVIAVAHSDFDPNLGTGGFTGVVVPDGA